MRHYAFPSRWNGLVFRAIDRIVRRNSLGRARAATFARTTTSATSSTANGSTRASPIPRRSSATATDLERGQAASTTASSTASATASGYSRSAAAGAASPSAPPAAATPSPPSPSRRARRPIADARLDGRADVQLRDYRAHQRAPPGHRLDRDGRGGRRALLADLLRDARGPARRGRQGRDPGDHRVRRLLSAVSPRHRLHPPLDLSRAGCCSATGRSPSRRPAPASAPTRPSPSASTTP